MSSVANAATLVTETTDFSNLTSTATDLTATWANFVTDGGVAGSISPGGTDGHDYFMVSAPANTPVVVPFSLTTLGSVTFPSIFVYDGQTNSQLGSLYYGSNLDVGEEFTGNLSFTAPSSGKVIFGFSHEGGSGLANYTIGAVPEAGTSVLGLAGLAAAALRRHRKNSQ